MLRMNMLSSPQQLTAPTTPIRQMSFAPTAPTTRTAVAAPQLAPQQPTTGAISSAPRTQPMTNAMGMQAAERGGAMAAPALGQQAGPPQPITASGPPQPVNRTAQTPIGPPQPITTSNQQPITGQQQSNAMGMQAAQQQAMAPAQNMANRGAFAAGVPALAAAQAQQPQQSVEQQALNGGGVDNKQQISNFMNALRGVHAGDNNTFSQGTEPQAQGAPAPLVGLVGPQATQQFPAGQTPFQIPSRAPIVQNNDFIMRALGADSGGLAPAPHQPVPIPGSAAPSTASSPANTGMNSGAGGLVGGGTMSGGGAPAPVPAPFQRNMPTFDPSVMAAMSDETQKDHVSDATGKLTDFMSTIGAHSYQYKDPDADGHGTYTTPMAQELQKTELGKQAVIETPRGLMVNYGRLGGVTLAAVSVVHREQQKLAQQVEWLRGELRKGRS